MPSISYYSPSFAETFNLNGDGLFVGTASPLRSYAYDFTLSYRGISNVTNDAKEVTIDLISNDNNRLDALRHAFNKDLNNMTPGVLHVDDYSTRFYCLGMTAELIDPNVRKASMSIALIDSAWSKEHLLRLFPVVAEGNGPDHPYDYEYDLGSSGAAKALSVSSTIDAALKIVFYGQCTNPQIQIGGNTYQVLTEVTEGARVEIDTRDKSIIFIDAHGNQSDIFSLGVRSSGKGSGHYVFEPLKPGENLIAWDGSFGVDVTYYEEDTIPPWSL